MNIDDLLTKYFDGETSFEEEQRLRAFFASGQVPERLAIYKPMFTYFDEEIKKRQLQKERKPFFSRRRLLYSLSGVAAGVLLLIGIRQAFFPPDPCLCSDSYVIINGRCYTDIDKVKALAFEALQEVATPVNEYFPNRDEVAIDREMIENQLKELSDIFSDDK